MHTYIYIYIYILVKMSDKQIEPRALIEEVAHEDPAQE